MTASLSHPGTATVSTRDRILSLFAQTMGYVGATVALFSLGAYLGHDLSGGARIVAFVAALAGLVAMQSSARRTQRHPTVVVSGPGQARGAAVVQEIRSQAGRAEFILPPRPLCRWHSGVRRRHHQGLVDRAPGHAGGASDAEFVHGTVLDVDGGRTQVAVIAG